VVKQFFIVPLLNVYSIPLLFLLSAVCLAGYGTDSDSFSADADVCTGCKDGFYQAGASTDCLTCGTMAAFTFAGKNDAVGPVAATTKPPSAATVAGAVSLDQCYPQYYQMDESMGTHIVNYTGLTATGDATATACATMCNDANTDCIAATFVYTSTLSSASADNSGACYKVTNSGTGGQLAVKVLPLDYLSGASSGKAAVASGSYVFWVQGYATKLGVELATYTDKDLQACKDLCDNNAACVLFQHDGTNGCALRTGLEAEGARTFMHIVGDKIDTA
jgi:hypothetical protein